MYSETCSIEIWKTVSQLRLSNALEIELPSLISFLKAGCHGNIQIYSQLLPVVKSMKNNDISQIIHSLWEGKSKIRVKDDLIFVKCFYDFLVEFGSESNDISNLLQWPILHILNLKFREDSGKTAIIVNIFCSAHVTLGLKSKDIFCLQPNRAA